VYRVDSVSIFAIARRATQHSAQRSGGHDALETLPKNFSDRQNMMEFPVGRHMSSDLALVTVCPHVGEETDLCSALSATDLTDEVTLVTRRHGSGTELCRKIL